ncbi:MAG TPA: hypothetical protein VHE81_14145 [Lacipirellulaceae bacterium]|nr:hypothetical protein [Lacipirellulaceae bacterium]
MTDIIQQFLEHAKIRASKSTAVTPAGWVIGALLTAVIAVVRIAPNSWALVFLTILAAIVVLSFVGLYWFFAIYHPDALRSEKYNITKMAIEHSAKGDNVVGLVEAGDMPKLLPRHDAAEEQNG